MALLADTLAVMKQGIAHRADGVTNFHGHNKVPGFRFDGSGRSFQSAAVEGVKHDGSGWRENGTLASCNRMVPDGLKVGGDWFGKTAVGLPNQSPMRQHSSKSPARKAASALIAKIPFSLASHIAAVYRGRGAGLAAVAPAGAPGPR